MKSLIIKAFSGLFVILIVAGCGTDRRMTAEEREAKIDSLFAAEAAKLSHEMALICQQRLDDELDARVLDMQTDPDAFVQGQHPGGRVEHPHQEADPRVHDEQPGTDHSGRMDRAEEQTSPGDDRHPHPVTAIAEVEGETDEEYIQRRVQENLDKLRAELEQQCEEEILAAARQQIDGEEFARDDQRISPGTVPDAQITAPAE